MDTNKLKRFASEARNILLKGVEQRLKALGFDSDGSVAEKPELKGGGAVFMGSIQTEDFYHKWMSLYHRVQSHSYKDVLEEGAYTWFNRLVAIRIMVKNELITPILEYESEDVRIPLIVTDARQGRMPKMNDDTRQKLETLLNNDALTDEQFRVLIVSFCHSNPVINKCFGAISDYTELLLPSNILSADGFIDRLNADDYISDEDYKTSELIGWLYQFYISDRKDEVFAKKGKFEADEIPAATQIFTPNWIVKYMVQNTLGRIYLDNNPTSDIKEEMKYLVEPAEPTPADAIYHVEDIHDLTCGDLGCGSGHILNECFDLFFQIYIEEGYNARKAVEDIFNYNLIGIDIDTRAKQLATFALLMKACQKDRSFADAHCMPKIWDMPKPYAEAMELEPSDDEGSLLRDNIRNFIQGDNSDVINELSDAILLMNDAQNLGSIMKFDISEKTHNIIQARTEEYESQENVSESIQMLLPYMRVILALTKKYSALVMNPPYMGNVNMNNVLSKYVKENYEIGKADIATVFVQHMAELTYKKGKYAFIIPPSWMFLSTFEGLRRNIIDNQSIDSLLHLSRGVFGADFGASSAVISNVQNKTAKGTYFRLIKRTFQEFDQKHLQLLFEKTLINPDFKYYFADYSKDVTDIVYSENGAKIYYPSIAQSDFEKIPGCPIGYWVSEKMISTFTSNAVGDSFILRVGLATGHSELFVRNWHEVSIKFIGINYGTRESASNSSAVWFPYNKGGIGRKWYGNNEYLVNWYKDGYTIKQKKMKDLKEGKITANNSKCWNQEFYFKESVNWTKISSSSFSARYSYCGSIFSDASNGAFKINENDSLFELLGLLNSTYAKQVLALISPTLNFTSGEISKIPLQQLNIKKLESIVLLNISISKLDWDSHETSWDFQTNEIVSLDSDEKYIATIQDTYEGKGMMPDLAAPQLPSLEWRTEIFKEKWEDKFNRLHANEEELNRQFIDIYGLQDELTPDVPLDEITILQQGEISIENDKILWHDDILMEQLISYAVGCMIGRYSIDKPGLILANQGDGMKEYEALVPNSRFEIDDDGIIPMMPANVEFTDNITLRFKTWLSTTFGKETLVDNLNFIEKSLGKRIDDYFVKDFWKDHKKMYQNRPIYWLFSSKKGAFQCIAYMHRMNAYTAEKVRTKYLLPHIEWLTAKQNEMQANAANLSTRERKEMDIIGKQIDECREYHDRLHVIADKQIDFDLDDGVVVNYAKFGDVLAKLK